MKLSWDEWQKATRDIYERNGLKGWPRGEMHRYYEDGMTPLEAYESASKRRSTSSTNATAGEQTS